jgi:hypothetical protein
MAGRDAVDDIAITRFPDAGAFIVYSGILSITVALWIVGH